MLRPSVLVLLAFSLAFLGVHSGVDGVGSSAKSLLAGKSDVTLFQSVRSFARDHPALVEQLVRKIANLLPEHEADIYRRRVLSALYEATDGAGCNICQVVVELLRLAVRTQGYPEVEATIIEACEVLGVAIDQNMQVKTICPGAIQLQGPHVNAVVSSSVTVASICEYVNACYTSSAIETGWPPEPVNSDTKVKVNKAKAKRTRRKRGMRTKRSKSSRADGTIKIAQLTDVHLEPDYAQGSATDCGLYVCCQSAYGTGPSGYFGDYNCNIPRRTIELFLRKVRDLAPDLVVFSGDVPPHTVWEETLQSQLGCTSTLVQSMQSIFGTGIRVLPAIGNHEMYPTNLYSVSQLGNATVPLLLSFADLWRQLAQFTDSELATMRSSGYYVTQVAPGLRLIAMATSYMYVNNWYNVLNHNEISANEAQKAKAAVEEYLRNASCEGQKVIMLMHHVVGGSDYLVEEAKWYEQLMVDYSDLVVLQVAGHTHSDEFRLLSDSELNVRSTLYVSPSLDTHGYRNPSVRIYELDSSTYELVDYTQYYFDLSQHDPDNSFDPTIVELYSAKSEYGLENLTAASWLDLLNRFAVDDELLLKHIQHSAADATETGTFECNSTCRLKHLCTMRYASYDRYYDCIHQYDVETTVNPSSTVTLPILTYPSLPSTPQPSTTTTRGTIRPPSTGGTEAGSTSAPTTTAPTRDRCYDVPFTPPATSSVNVK